MSKLEDFLNESETFAGVTFNGMYTMPLKAFIMAWEHYKETGENVLDEYSRLVYLSWMDDSRLFDQDEIIKTEEVLKNNGFWNIHHKLTGQDIKTIRFVINNSRKFWERKNSYELKRLQASLFTSRPDIRKKVYDLHGKECLSCGETEKIEMDHVIPIVKGGENTIENLQPLCKSCNTSKRDQIIDYRK